MTDPDLPTFVEALVKGGNALDALGHTAEALINYDCALALAPHVAGIHYNRGLVLCKLGRIGMSVNFRHLRSAGYRPC
jgi:tetratricopeptide (TPR) repeat protein